MKTKRMHFITAIFAVIFLHNGFAQEKKTTEAKLNDATVFFQGAELSHSASSALNKGENEIWIEGLSPNIDKNSLKIKASNGVVISSYEFSVDYLSELKKIPNPMVKKIQDSIDFYNKKVALVDTDIKVNLELISILKKSTDKNTSGSEKGVSIDELMKTMEYYRTKQTELENTQRKLNKDRAEWITAVNRLNSQLSQESVKNNKTAGMLKLNLTAPLAVTANFTISYYTPSASWIPYYDISVSSIDKPIQIIGKAKVRQITGLDWSKVKLTLSSAMPSNGKIAPLFSTWFLQQQRAMYDEVMLTQNAYSYARKETRAMEKLSFSDVQEVAVTPAAPSPKQKEPLYIVDGTPVDANYYMAIDPGMIKSKVQLYGNDAIQQYGKEASSGAYVIELKSSMDDYVVQADNELNSVFNIEIPYTIPGNGKEQSITLLSKETSAEYKYYSAPKLDTQTFLLAEIADWQKLGLLSGKANVTYDGTYIGETFIDASSTSDKLPLTLGTDKRVAVKREKLKEFSSTKFLGNDVKQVFTYKITVRNNQNKAIKMVLKDQYPISQEKGIEVELLTKESTPWSANKEEVGVITWEEELAPGQTKEYRISYSVKYPKGANLNL